MHTYWVALRIGLFEDELLRTLAAKPISSLSRATELMRFFLAIVNTFLCQLLPEAPFNHSRSNPDPFSVLREPRLSALLDLFCCI